MRKMVVAELMSLGSIMQAPSGTEEDTEGGFTHGGWTGPSWHDDLGAHFFQATSESDAMLLGRKTWQGHGAAFEPMPAGDPFGDVMKAIPKYVVSTTLTDVSAWQNSTLIKDNVVEQVRALKAQPGTNMVIDGSSVLGGGKKVFPDGLRVGLRLVEIRSFPAAVVLMGYASPLPGSTTGGSR